ncbi:hypothetical protein G7Y89_g15298 [Cudoniella acicularis]|uniref:Uncharacterized protein n=1 Tax=Cudoniella acicularis TaxID=354080 RepID=A0A8H4QQK6_9HELO|nr:hypothetical protein G7Y89_g15298 [Cudoniella acicularis]
MLQRLARLWIHPFSRLTLHGSHGTVQQRLSWGMMGLALRQGSVDDAGEAVLLGSSGVFFGSASAPWLSPPICHITRGRRAPLSAASGLLAVIAPATKLFDSGLSSAFWLSGESAESAENSVSASLGRRQALLGPDEGSMVGVTALRRHHREPGRLLSEDTGGLIGVALTLLVTQGFDSVNWLLRRVEDCESAMFCLQRNGVSSSHQNFTWKLWSGPFLPRPEPR